MQQTATSIRPISLETSAKLANMSFVCALLVVCHHIQYAREVGSTYWFWERFTTYGVSSVAVPFFFAASGFLIAGHMNESGWVRRELRKRVATLLVPFFCWVALYALYSLLVVSLCNMVNHRPLLYAYPINFTAWLSRFGLSIWSMPQPAVLWYVRALILFVSCGSMFKLLNCRCGLLVGFILYAFLCPFSYDGWTYPLRFFWSLEGMFFFLVGFFSVHTTYRPPKKEHI